MQINKKIILALGAALILFVLGLCLATHIILLKTYSEIENRRAVANTIRIQKAFDRVLSELSTTTNDWAHYDDAYEFVAGRNPRFVEDNINLEGLKTLNINAFTYFSIQGVTLLNVATSDDYSRFISLPKDYAEKLNFKFLLNQINQSKQHEFKGLLALPQRIMLVAASGVTDAAVSKRDNGLLLTGRYLSSELVAKIADRTSLDLKLILLPEIKKNKELTLFFNKTIADPKGVFVTLKTNEEKYIYGYVLLRDIYQKPLALIEMTSERSVYAVGVSAINYFIFVFIITGFLLSFLIWFLMRLFVVKRILKLSEQIAHIGLQGDYSLRVDVIGKDEIACLAAEFNSMMDIIQHNHQQLLLKVRDLSESEAKIKGVNVKLTREFQKRKIEEDRASLFNQKLLSQARLAGSAEIATSILHNIGNILTSVKVSVQHIDKENEHFVSSKLGNIIQLLSLHQADLNDFLANDSKGQLIAEYITALAQLIIDKNISDAEELLHLRDLIAHIEDIIAMQREQIS